MKWTIVNARTMLAACLIAIATILAHGCVSAQRTGEATRMAEEAKGHITILNEQIDQLWLDAMALPPDDPARDVILAWRDDLDEKRAEWTPILTQAENTIRRGNDGWSWMDLGLAVLALFSPVSAGVGTVLVRRGRATFNETVTAIAAGGGPIDPGATKNEMSLAVRAKVKAIRETPRVQLIEAEARERIGDPAVVSPA